MSTELETRVTALEETAAHQAKTIEELSDELTRQYRAVERLAGQVEALVNRFLALEEQSRDPAPISRPPHY